MGCIGRIAKVYRQRMYDLLALYARPYDRREPVVCVDEKRKQLLAHTRAALPARCGAPLKEDYEYCRAGTRNLFVAVEPQGGRREVQVAARRAKRDFVGFVRHLADTVHATARRIHLVFDNLNTHFRSTFIDVMGPRDTATLLRRIEFHDTHKHASWLNRAEIEIGILDRQCMGGRIASADALAADVAAWQQRRNAERRRIDWPFTRQDADRKLGHRYAV